MTKQFYIEVSRDEEVDMYYISDSNVPGLVAEADTIDALITKANELTPMLLFENAHLIKGEHGGRLRVQTDFDMPIAAYG